MKMMISSREVRCRTHRFVKLARNENDIKDERVTQAERESCFLCKAFFYW